VVGLKALYCPRRVEAGAACSYEELSVRRLRFLLERVGYVKGSRSSRTSNIVTLAWTFNPHAFQESPVEH
jgi:hypothetical protein